MVLLGFNIGKSDDGGMGKSLDDIIADRRKEQSKALSGKKGTPTSRSSTRSSKKTAMADRSVATGRAKRAAAARARRGIGGNNSDNKKPSAMEVEKEVYRQTRKTAAAKKASEKKATNGRVAPNSTLREKRQKKPTNDPPGALVGRMPQQKQIKAAIQGMELAGCPVPKGYQLVMHFASVNTPTNGNAKGKQQAKANNNNNNSNKNTNNKNKNNNNAVNQKAGNRRKSGGRGKK